MTNKGYFCPPISLDVHIHNDDLHVYMDKNFINDLQNFRCLNYSFTVALPLTNVAYIDID